jgi:PTH1 family peptidyl-tRNA hydrolase
VILFVGLGNIGLEYEETRHNIGFKIIDALINDLGARDISKKSFHGRLYRQSDLLFLKPNTYMNLSGKSVQPIKQFFKVEVDDIIVIHDDIDLPFGALRFKRGGGHGGHNGLKSIDTHIGKEYLRVRVGVGKPEYRTQVPEYVLSDFSSSENKHLESLINHVSKASKMLLEEELSKIKSLYSLKSIEALSL